MTHITEQALRSVCPWTQHSEHLKELSFIWRHLLAIK